MTTGSETCADAQRRIVADLGDRVLGSSVVDQVVSVGERTGEPIEWQMRPHWMLRVLDLCDELLDRSAALRFPADRLRCAARRLDPGARHDWNLTRQRFYGVPFPVWFCTVDGCAGRSAPTSGRCRSTRSRTAHRSRPAPTAGANWRATPT